ncbi:MAG: tRNA-dihydrouridine synthase [Treponema sp.]|jgi:nifR3 family TIM-barrel protein|nr:tRNA-dihydrouridine synthase [Treponema sp.]
MDRSSPLYHPLTIGSLELPGNLFLAPVAGFTDRAFRSICAEAGADLCFTELVSAEAVTRRPEQYGLGVAGDRAPAAAALLRRGVSEKRYAVQLFGGSPETLGRACALLAPLRPDAVDLNAGCPVPKVVKSGAGSALMRNPALLGRIAGAMVTASRKYLGDVPVTVKMRSGWDAASINYAQCARSAVEAGAAMITLHPRTRSQGYGGTSDWSHIADLASRLSVPVAGSGDLFTPEDAERMFRETGCAALMFARGAQGNPPIFGAAKALFRGGSYAAAPEHLNRERLRMGLRHLELLAGDLGEKSACLEMRKQFCAYTRGAMGMPGLAGGGALREKLVHARTIAEYVTIVSPFLLCL